MRALVRWLYRLARLGRDVEVLASGDPAKIGRRLANKMLGRHVVRRVWWRPLRRRGEPR
ncbi:MAG: hypothetical protein K6W08_12280 [Firmicutes bacterium]|nr:hypothetical protein [Bacillota bacterium]